MGGNFIFVYSTKRGPGIKKICMQLYYRRLISLLKQGFYLLQGVLLQSYSVYSIRACSLHATLIKMANRTLVSSSS